MTGIEVIPPIIAGVGLVIELSSRAYGHWRRKTSKAKALSENTPEESTHGSAATQNQCDSHTSSPHKGSTAPGRRGDSRGMPRSSTDPKLQVYPHLISARSKSSLHTRLRSFRSTTDLHHRATCSGDWRECSCVAPVETERGFTELKPIANTMTSIIADTATVASARSRHDSDSFSDRSSFTSYDNSTIREAEAEDLRKRNLEKERALATAKELYATSSQSRSAGETKEDHQILLDHILADTDDDEPLSPLEKDRIGVTVKNLCRYVSPESKQED